jgi:two-component system, OmpR family, sensor kinase
MRSTFSLSQRTSRARRSWRVLVQLEVLVRKLEGEDLELALGALRSTRRIERLLEQLPAVSRLDAAGTREDARVDLADVVLDVAEELECVAQPRT